MGEEFSVAELNRQVGDLRVQVGQLQTLQEAQHKQNRDDIHEIRGTLQSLVDLVTSLRIKQAVWSASAGIMTGIAIKAIDIFGHMVFGK